MRFRYATIRLLRSPTNLTPLPPLAMDKPYLLLDSLPRQMSTAMLLLTMVIIRSLAPRFLSGLGLTNLLAVHGSYQYASIENLPLKICGCEGKRTNMHPFDRTSSATFPSSPSISTDHASSKID